MTGFRIVTDTFDRATKEIAIYARRNAHAYGLHIASEYKRNAKQDAPWEERRGVARRGIKGKVSQAGDRVTVTMGATAPNYKTGPKSTNDYMEYLEFGHGGRFATVYPTVESMKADILKNFGTAALTGSFVRIQRDKMGAMRRAAKSRAFARARASERRSELKAAAKARMKAYRKTSEYKRLYSKKIRR